MAKSLPLLLSGSLLIAQEGIAEVTRLTQPSEITQNNAEILEQVETYSNETLDQQVQDASRFRDVSPNDWAFQALDDLIRRYDCLVGYPDGTFRGDRPLTRYEFAAGLNACLNQIERIIAAATTDFVSREDIETLQALLQEFEAELSELGRRVESLEARTAFLEDNQFSTTTKLRGEVIFNVADVFTNLNQTFDNDRDGLRDDVTPGGGNTVFSSRARLNLATSFNGRDRLRLTLEGRNIISPIRTIRNNRITNEGRLAVEGGTNNDFRIGFVNYIFPILDGRGQVDIFASGAGPNDILDPVNPFGSGSSGWVGTFAQYNPIYRVGNQSAGLEVAFDLTDNINAGAFYITGEANIPGPSSGFFVGDYTAGAQVTFDYDRFTIAGTYITSYSGRNKGLDWGVGSIGANFGVNNPAFGGLAPVDSNSYGIQAKFDLTDNLFIGGWGGHTAVTAIGTGDGDIWTWAGYIGLRDVGVEGSKLGFLVGMEPKLTGSDASIGLAGVQGLSVGDRADRDTSLHLEAMYVFPVSDNILITPGIIAITNPGHNSTNPTLWIGTVRTTFTF